MWNPSSVADFYFTYDFCIFIKSPINCSFTTVIPHERRDLTITPFTVSEVFFDYLDYLGYPGHRLFKS